MSEASSIGASIDLSHAANHRTQLCEIFTVMSTGKVYSHTTQAGVGEEYAPVQLSYYLNEESKLSKK